MKDKIISYISSLNPREKNILVFFIFFFLFFSVAVMYFVMNSAIDDKKNAIIEQEKMLSKISALKLEFQKAKDQQKMMFASVRNNTVNINSYISSIKDSAGVDINTIKDLKPEKKGELTIEKTELSMRSVELTRLFTFLYATENKARFVFIDSIAIKKRFDKQNYEATLTVATIKQDSKATEEEITQ